jgi:hypothetical protein
MRFGFGDVCLVVMLGDGHIWSLAMLEVGGDVNDVMMRDCRDAA